MGVGAGHQEWISMQKATIISGLIAIIMVTCALPFTASEDSDALIGNTEGMSLNVDSAVLYQTGGTSSVQLSITQTLAGDVASDATWYLHDIDDGTSFVQLSNTSGASVTVFVTSLANGVNVASVEVVANIGNHHASAVIVVYPSPGTPAETFHFFFQIKEEAYAHVQANNSANVNLPSGYTMAQFYTGFWVSVTKAQADSNNNGFTALSALQWYLNTHGWSNSFGSYGWINQLLGLGTYPGDNGVWYYWAQYHAVDGGWAFNNTTLGFITTVDQSYIGMIFWGSPNAETMPTPFPGIPS